MKSKPRIRILHQLARSGGTVISRCLASMEKVALLSEIHPLGARWFNPLDQARQWFNLLSEKDLSDISASSGIDFVDAIDLIRTRCEERGVQLVIRDWTHLDFVGIPFLDSPSLRLLTADTLSQRFDVIQVATVRHPLHQYFSLIRLPHVQGKLSLPTYLSNCMQFSEHCSRIGFFRYEDFVVDPDTVLRGICDQLAIDFDPTYIERWATYDNITGDDSRLRDPEIKAPPCPAVDPGLVERLNKNEHYRRSLQLLGYDDLASSCG